MQVVTVPVLVFSSLLSVYLKSSQIVSAGSPEAKPAEAHGSDSAMRRGRAVTSGSCHPLFLVHLSCHCHQWGQLSYGLHAGLPLLVIYSPCSKRLFYHSEA